MEFKKILTLSFIAWFLLSFSTYLQAQELIGFEEFSLEAESFYDGSDGAGGFGSGDLFFYNTYNAEFFFWTGFSYSNVTDNTTPGYANQYSAYAGSGADASDNYVVGYIPAHLSLDVPQYIPSAAFTNNTYTALSMLNGDDFAKKFGGASGDDPDFLLLEIVGFADGDSLNTVPFYLADYRFEDNTQDYIVQDWTTVDLYDLGQVDSVVFRLSSSDVGDFGMNTPAYFCMDNIDLSTMLATESIETISLNVYPNPASDVLQIESLEAIERYSIYNIKGELIQTKVLDSQKNITISIEDLMPNTYIIQCQTKEGIVHKRFTKF